LPKFTKPRFAMHVAPADSSRALLWLGSPVLGMSAVLLITMPFTQHFWAWDHFLHGGQDFELAALTFLIAVALMLVLSGHCKQCIDPLLMRCRLAACRSGKLRRIVIPFHSFVLIMQTGPLISPTSGTYSIPLQI
jgi:hypothetical protein